MFSATCQEIASAIGGRLFGAGSCAVRGVEFDSRRVTEGQLFVALPGAASHGHAFVEKAVRQGAAAVLVESESVALAAGVPAILVPKSLDGFQALGAYWRRKVGVPLIAITGSVGKTTTKELAAAILGAAFGRGSYSQASFNNHVGVPYTLLSIAPDDSWAVVEMGMNHRHEIEPLSRMAAPDVVVVTAIAPAHIGNLGSLEEIAREKLDIVRGLQSLGDPKIPQIILNGDAPYLRDEAMLEYANLRTDSREGVASVWYIGHRTNAEPRDREPLAFEIATCTSTSDSLSLELIDHTASLGEVSMPIKFASKLVGEHQGGNIALAFAAAVALFRRVMEGRTAVRRAPEHFPIELVRKALADFAAPERRFVRRKASARFGGVDLIDDSYNANPASMRAFLAATAPLRQGKLWGMILGEMRELGAFQAEYHAQIAREVVAQGARLLVLVGTQGARDYERALADGVALPTGCQVVRVDAADQVANALTHLMTTEQIKTVPGERGEFRLPVELLLVKGARGVALERAIEVITKDG